MKRNITPQPTGNLGNVGLIEREMREDRSDTNALLNELQETLYPVLVQHFREADVKLQRPLTIYHYTNVRAALDILKTGQLWFTERTHLNDPVEVRYSLEIAHRLFETAAKRRGKVIPEDVASRLNYEHNVALTENGFWICSFSLDGDDLTQWRNYADDGRGVCLGVSAEHFDESEVRKSLPKDHITFKFPVQYDEYELQRNLREYITISLDVLERIHTQRNIPPSVYEKEFCRILNQGFYTSSVRFKHNAYRHEQEYRILASGDRDQITKNDRHRFRERNGEIVGYLELPIPKWKREGMLTHIRLGPAAPDQLADQFRMVLMTFGVPEPSIDKSAMPYRSMR